MIAEHSETVRRYYETSPTEGFTIISCDWRTNPIAEKSAMFRRLADDWFEKTAGFSRVADKIEHESYEKIIAWGDEAEPHILADLRENPEQPKHWFVALQKITGADPVPKEHRGDLKRMAEAWLKWGRDREKIH